MHSQRAGRSPDSLVSRQAPKPRGALLRGALAGLAGTAAMTAWQGASTKLQASNSAEPQGDPPQDPWEEAPAPAKVAKRISEGIFHQDVPPELIPLLSNAMHWAYGTGWGVAYGLVAGGRRGPAIRRGLAFGSAVWASSYAELVPMGIYEPPWKYEPEELALDLSYHLAYGLGTALASQLLSR
jgi:hypothetical protein